MPLFGLGVGFWLQDVCMRRLCSVRMGKWRQHNAVVIQLRENELTRGLCSLCTGCCCHGAQSLVNMHPSYLWLFEPLFETGLLKLFGWFMMKILMSVSQRQTPTHVVAVSSWVKNSQSHRCPRQGGDFSMRCQCCIESLAVCVRLTL